MDRYNVRFVKWFSGGHGEFAITIGQTAYYSCSAEQVTPTWRAHEDEHKAQFRRLGLLGFFQKYVREYLQQRFRGLSHWDAYKAISLEVEAREAAARITAMPA